MENQCQRKTMVLPSLMFVLVVVIVLFLLLL